MTGTEKQIVWAEEIKEKAYARANNKIRSAELMIKFTNQKREQEGFGSLSENAPVVKQLKMYNTIVKLLDIMFAKKLNNDAGTIIDNRDNIKKTVNQLFGLEDNKGIDYAYERIQMIYNNEIND